MNVRRILGLVAVSLMLSCTCFGKETILVTLSSGNVKKLTVETNVCSSTLDFCYGGNTVYDGMKLNPAAIDRVGMTIYIASDAAVNSTSYPILMFSLDGKYKGVFKIVNQRLDCFLHSSDGRYLYASSAFGSNNNKIYRYDLRDGTEEVFISTTGWMDVDGNAFSGSLSTPRQMAWGPQGELVVMCRGTRTATAFDAVTGRVIKTVAVIPEDVKGGIIYDPVRRCYFISALKSVYRVPVDGTPTPVKAFTSADMENSFGGTMIGDTVYFASYTAKKILSYDTNNVLSTLKEMGASVNQIVSFDDALSSLTAEWDFEDADNSPMFANATDGSSYPMIAKRKMQNTITGVEGKGVWLHENSRGEILSSEKIIPTNGDFSVFFWIGLHPRTPLGERYILSNSRGSQGGRSAIMANLDGKANKLGWFHEGGVKLFSTNDIVDGAWHHAGIIRRDNLFEMWLDGICQTSDVSSAKISNDYNWRVGSGANEEMGHTGPCFLDKIQVFSAALSSNAVFALSHEITCSRGDLPIPEVPAPAPLFDSHAADVFGAVVDHEDGYDAAIGAPSLLKLSNGVFLLARDRGLDDGGANDACTVVYRSVDNGVTWSPVATNTGLCNASLFQAGSSLHMLGTKIRYGNIVLATSSDNGVTWTRNNFSTVFGNELNASPVCFQGGRIWKSAMGDSADGERPCVLSAALSSEGILSDWKYSSRAGYSTFWGGKEKILPYQRYGLGVLASDLSGKIRYLAPLAFQQRTTSYGVPESVGILSVPDNGTSAPGYNGVDCMMLPGGSKPFHIVYDEVSKRYWTVTTAAHFPADRAVKLCLADRIRHRLCLYSSRTLRDWAYHATLLEGDVETNGMNDPAFVLDGDDLLVAFSVACPDGATGARRLEDGNFLVVRRFADFRSYARDKNAYDRLLVCDPGSSRVVRYYRNSLQEWCEDGFFATGSYGGKKLFSPNALAVFRDNVYVLDAADEGSLYEFSKKGVFQRIVMTFKPRSDVKSRMDSMAISPDGKWIYVSELFSGVYKAEDGFQQIWKVDRLTGALSAFIANTGWGGSFKGPRGILCDAEGRLYVSDRNQGVFRFLPDGTLDSTFTSFGFNNSIQSICIDAAGENLYNSTAYNGTITVRPFSNLQSSSLYFRLMDSANSLSVQFLKGVIYASNYNTGCLETKNGTTTGSIVQISGNWNASGFLYLPLGASVWPDSNEGTVLQMR